jgi:hypothetical protein
MGFKEELEDDSSHKGIRNAKEKAVSNQIDIMHGHASKDVNDIRGRRC